jgi:hypothetical protein
LKPPSIFGWYRILRTRHQFTVFEAMRCALWLAMGCGKYDFWPDKSLQSNGLAVSLAESQPSRRALVIVTLR